MGGVEIASFPGAGRDAEYIGSGEEGRVERSLRYGGNGGRNRESGNERILRWKQG